eukprot:8672209-Alexandrium_andersonii.AAC.1
MGGVRTRSTSSDWPSRGGLGPGEVVQCGARQVPQLPRMRRGGRGHQAPAVAVSGHCRGQGS